MRRGVPASRAPLLLKGHDPFRAGSPTIGNQAGELARSLMGFLTIVPITWSLAGSTPRLNDDREPPGFRSVRDARMRRDEL